MNQSHEDVYYRRQGYAGLWRRLLAAVVDAIVLAWTLSLSEVRRAK